MTKATKIIYNNSQQMEVCTVNNEMSSMKILLACVFVWAPTLGAVFSQKQPDTWEILA